MSGNKTPAILLAPNEIAGVLLWETLLMARLLTTEDLPRLAWVCEPEGIHSLGQGFTMPRHGSVTEEGSITMVYATDIRGITLNKSPSGNKPP